MLCICISTYAPLFIAIYFPSISFNNPRTASPQLLKTTSVMDITA